MLTADSSLADFQTHNAQIYSVTNDRYYGPDGIFIRLIEHVGRVTKIVRKSHDGQFPKIDYHLCMAFSWALAMFNRYHLDLGAEMWKRFPGRCPYCTFVPCRCAEIGKRGERGILEPEGIVPSSLDAWQKMFWAIYPNTIKESASHLAEEAIEVNIAIYYFLHSATESAAFDHVVEELVDVVTNILAVANCLKLYLSDRMAIYFNEGCPGCKLAPCGCGFVTAEERSLR